MSGKNARVVFQDPPYNVKMKDVVGRGGQKYEEFRCASGEMSPEEFKAFLHATIKNARENCVPGSLLYICMDWRHLEILLEVGRTLNLHLLNIVIWNKTNAGQGSFYRSQHE